MKLISSNIGLLEWKLLWKLVILEWNWYFVLLLPNDITICIPSFFLLYGEGRAKRLWISAVMNKRTNETWNKWITTVLLRMSSLANLRYRWLVLSSVPELWKLWNGFWCSWNECQRGILRLHSACNEQICSKNRQGQLSTEFKGERLYNFQTDKCAWFQKKCWLWQARGWENGAIQHHSYDRWVATNICNQIALDGFRKRVKIP